MLSIRASQLILLAIVAVSTITAFPAEAKDVIVDLSSIAPADAKRIPPPPKQPVQQSIEMNPDDILVVKCPTKQFPGDKGWVEYHAALLGKGCLISSMNRQEAHAEVFQATSPGSQKIVAGLKQPGSSQIEQDCVVTVKVVATAVQPGVQNSSSNVQSYAGQKVFGNKTSATTGTNNGINYAGSTVEKNQPKPATHSIEEQSHSTVKSY